MYNTWEELSEILQTAAAETIGYKTANDAQKIDDEELKQMSATLKNIHLEITKESNAEKLKDLKVGNVEGWKVKKLRNWEVEINENLKNHKVEMRRWRE